MRKLLIIVSLFLFSSCTIIEIMAIKETSFIDFTEFQDFYLSQSNSASFPFSPLGIVTAICVSGKEVVSNQKEIKKKVTDDAYYSKNTTDSRNSKLIYVKATSQDALRLIYGRAKELGANGIINIKIDYLPADINTGLHNGYMITGMAIKKE